MGADGSIILAEKHPDSVAIVSEYLGQSGTGLYALVADRITDSPLEGHSLDDDSLVVKRPTGRPMASVPIDRARIEIAAYGAHANPQRCMDVYLEALYLLHRAVAVTCSSGILMSARQAGGGGLVPTPEGNTPFVLGFFSVLTRPL